MNRLRNWRLFLTLLFGSLASFLGMGMVTLTAGIDELRPPHCQGNERCEEPQKWQLAYLFAGLGFMAIGSGALSIMIFLIGRTLTFMKPQGCVFIDMAKVINAAFRKRHIRTVPTANSLYDRATNESENELSVLRHSDRFNYLDKAAVIVDRSSELNAEGVATDSWRLCNIEQVENGNVLWNFTCLVSWNHLFHHHGTDECLKFFIIQSNTKVGNFMIPPGWMGLASMISLAIWIFIYECLYVPNASKISKKEARLSLQIRIKIGILMSILCLSAAALVETRRRDLAVKEGTFISPLGIVFFLPQFILSGLTEAFAAVSVMEFLNNQVPETMRSVAGAIFFLSLSIASYLNTLIVNSVEMLSGLHGRKPWLGGHDLNENRLERFSSYCWLGSNKLHILPFHCQPLHSKL
ncbi:hypothetical protein HAX54_051621 [Datura stramonium]|uniref:Uncharacterized protein n=1 Tax=Datura stramonium TaxID=4076 RepID=A0ABS8WQD9_DATST|nr:hypothetical protein [Datura stramonium]